LLARMIDAEQAWCAAGKPGFGAVRKEKSPARADRPTLFLDVQKGVPGDPAERENRARAEDLDFALEIRAAVQHLLRQRLVVGRGATAGRRDVGCAQFQAVLAIDGGRLVGEAGLVQRGVQKVAGAVAGKDAARAIAAVGCRSEADDEQ